MGFQFLHIEAYARHGSSSTASPRKWSAREIAAEAMREPDACPHVEQPQPPQVLHGCTQRRPREAGPTGPTAARTPRGASCAPMASPWLLGWCPCPLSSARTGPAFVKKPPWRGCGSNTASGCAPWWSTRTRPTRTCISTPCPCRERFRCFTQEGRPHQKKARQGAKKGRTERRIQAGHGGVAGWLSRAVAAHFGLTRRGPGKRRLTRGAWKAEQEQAGHWRSLCPQS